MQEKRTCLVIPVTTEMKKELDKLYKKSYSGRASSDMICDLISRGLAQVEAAEQKTEIS